MAVNLAAPPGDPVQQTALKRQFPRPLVGDFTFDHERGQHRHKILLSRNMTRVLAYHEKHRAREAESGIRTSSRLAGPYLGQTSVKRISGPSDVLLDVASRQQKPRDKNGETDVESDHDTSKPEIETVSQDCLKVKAQMDSFDGAKRRSLRRQLVNQHEDKDAQLNIDLVNIRKKLNFKETAGETDIRPRKRSKRDSIPCHCHLTVWDNRSALKREQDPLVRKSESAEVIVTRSEDDIIIVDINLEKAFVLKPNELKVTIEDPNGSILALSDKYFLEIKLIPIKGNGQWPPIPILGKSEGDQSNGLGQLAAEKLQGSLAMRYLHLPQAPRQDVPWSVFFLKDGKTYRSKYGLEVRSLWTKGSPEGFIKDEKNENGLASWAIDDENQPFGRKSSPRSKLPTIKPDPSPTIQAKITYNIDSIGGREAKEFRRATMKGLHCPACPKQSFAELKQLQHHFMTCHSKYKFLVEKEIRTPLTDELTSLSFKVTAASTAKARTLDREKGSHEDTFIWQAPTSGFDIDAFIDGDPRWIPDHPKKRSMTNHASIGLVQDQSSTWRQKFGGFLPAEFVPEFRSSTRQKHPSIKLNTMTEEKSIAYTSVSHRQRHLSEDPQSETDDEMDSEPFIQKSLESLDVEAQRNEWSNEDRLLRGKWNKARFSERLSHPRYLSDGLIRFIRAEKNWLCGGGIKVRLALSSFLEDLLIHRVINEDVVRDVWFILHETKSEEITQPPARDTVMEDMTIPIGIVDVTQPRSLRAQRLLSLPDYSCGFCAEFIVDVTMRGLRCSDINCDAPGIWYHARCARCKMRDKLAWKCPLCVERLGELVGPDFSKKAMFDEQNP